MSLPFNISSNADRVIRQSSYFSNTTGEDCSHIHRLPAADKCAFVKRTEACRENVYYFDYTYFLYCTIGQQDKQYFMLGIALLIIGMLIYFTLLGTTTDQFFCPVLAVISKNLGISECVAGVTILAWGNGSPDLFTALSNPYSDTEMMFGELLGAATFIVGIVAATVLIIKPFSLHPPGAIRDVLFFLGAVGWITYCAYDKKFSLFDAIMILVIYACYLMFVLGEFFFMKHQLREEESRVSLHGEVPIDNTYYKQLEGETKIIIRPRTNADAELDIKRNRVSVFYDVPQDEISKNYGLFWDFFRQLNPVDLDDWDEAGCFGKTVAVCLIPTRFVLKLFIPIMDYTLVRHGWSKLMNMLHCLTLPLFSLFVNGFFFTSVMEFPLWAGILIVSSIFMIIIFFTSRTDRPPAYHLAYAVLAFAGSIQVIYVIAQEVVSLLVTVGLVLNLSKSMLGLSVLAWGNSVGDLFSSITLAKRGYGKMAFAACMGGPLFNISLGFGVTMILKALKSPDLVAFSREGAMGENCEAFLVQLLGTILLTILITDFQGRRCIGYVLIYIYLLFFSFCLLSEMHIVHSYDSDDMYFFFSGP